MEFFEAVKMLKEWIGFAAVIRWSTEVSYTEGLEEITREVIYYVFMRSKHLI